MKKSPKLTIRVNVKQANNIIGKNKPTYQYYWGRIIIGILVLLAMASLALTTIFYYFNNKEVNKAVIEPLNSESSTPLQPSITRLTSPKTPDVKLDITEQPKEEQEAVNTTPSIKKNGNIIANETVKTEHEDITSPPINSNDEAVTLVSKKQQNKEVESINNEVDSKLTALKKVEHNPLFTKTKADITSENIKRFIITQSVRENEPVGTIKDISFNNNIATVYAFSEAVNLKDTTLYYIWSLNDKKVATVAIDIKANRWRSHSSKLIQTNMRGKWQVELQNENKETLAINKFVY